MNFLAKKTPYQRRKSDLEDWELTVNTIAMQLCPNIEFQAEEWRQTQLTKRSKTPLLFFPVWRRYRQEAVKVAHIQRAIPLLKHLPLEVSKFIGEVVYK